MKDLIILGTNGFAQEIAYLVERINLKENKWNFVGFVGKENANLNNKYLGNDAILSQYPNINAICAIGDPVLRNKVINNTKQQYPTITFTNLIDPSAIIANSAELKDGIIIQANSVIEVGCKIDTGTIINLNSTVGHETKIGRCVTINPGCNISGNTCIGDSVFIGTGTSIIQGINIGDNAIIGAGAVVIKNIEVNTKNVGVPTRVIT